MTQKAKELLDKALTYKPGLGVLLDFPNRGDRDALRQTLFSAMSVDVRLSKTTNDPTSAEWGTHRWGDIRVKGVGGHKLWVGRRAEYTVGGLMSLEKAQAGRQK